MPRLLALRPVVAAVAAVACAGAAVAVAQSGGDGRIGPDRGILNNGRHLHPFGAMTKVGQFPTGGALTPNGRFYWTVSTGRGVNDIRIVSVRSGKVVQTLPPARRLRRHRDGPQAAASRTCRASPTPRATATSSARARRASEGDVLHVFSLRPAGSGPRATGTIPVPPPVGRRRRRRTSRRRTAGQEGRLARPPGGLARRRHAARAAEPRRPGRRSSTSPTGRCATSRPAATPTARRSCATARPGLVSNEADGTVSVIDLAAARPRSRTSRSAPTSRTPRAIAVDPRADRAYVAVANSDQVAVIDTKRARGRAHALGRAARGPRHLAGRRHRHARRRLLLVAEAGADEIAVFELPAAAAAVGERRPSVLTQPRAAAAAGSRAEEPGLAPTSSRPRSADAHADRRSPSAGSVRRAAPREGSAARSCCGLPGKGLGAGPNPNGPNPDVRRRQRRRINSTSTCRC